MTNPIATPAIAATDMYAAARAIERAATTVAHAIIAGVSLRENRAALDGLYYASKSLLDAACEVSQAERNASLLASDTD